MQRTSVVPLDQMTWGRQYWTIYLAVAILFFIVPEVYALASGQPGNTLSNWVWVRLNIVAGETISMWSALDFLTFGAWCVMGVWLTWHFFLHKFT